MAVDPYATWLSEQADRIAARQRSQVETAKLLGTFAAGFAATIVGTALQVRASDVGWLDYASSGMVLLCLLTTVALVLADTLREVDHEIVIAHSRNLRLSSSETLRMLQVAHLASAFVNDGVVRRVRIALFMQLSAALVALVLSLSSVLV